LYNQPSISYRFFATKHHLAPPRLGIFALRTIPYAYALPFFVVHSTQSHKDARTQRRKDIFSVLESLGGLAAWRLCVEKTTTRFLDDREIYRKR
jgi:hypothetical protein